MRPQGLGADEIVAPGTEHALQGPVDLDEAAVVGDRARTQIAGRTAIADFQSGTTHDGGHTAVVVNTIETRGIHQRHFASASLRQATGTCDFLAHRNVVTAFESQRAIARHARRSAQRARGAAIANLQGTCTDRGRPTPIVVC